MEQFHYPRKFYWTALVWSKGRQFFSLKGQVVNILDYRNVKLATDISKWMSTTVSQYNLMDTGKTDPGIETIIHSISKSQCLYPAAELQIRSLFTNFIPWASVPLYFFFSYLVCLSNPPTNLIFWFYIFSQFSTKTSVKGLNNAKLGDQTKQ